MSDTGLYIEAVYRELCPLCGKKDVFLVQDNLTQKIYVKKKRSPLSAHIYTYLQEHPVPNIPRIIDMAQVEDDLIIIEDYISGQTLQELLDTQGCQQEADVAEYTLQICQVLEHLHHAQPPIIHRDITPANVLLSQDGVVKLIDLNIAKRSHQGQTRDTVLLGTAGYAAPEQYGTAPSTVQTDLYAVGVLMNVLLCGEHPTVRMAEGALAPIIRRCLAVNPQERYASAEELSDAIRHALRPKNTAQLPGWRRLLPPGFRGLNPLCMVFSALGYSMLLWLGLSMESTGEMSVPELWLTRIWLTGTFISMALFAGNYLEVHRVFPRFVHSNPFLRLCIVAASTLALGAFSLFLLVLLESLLTVFIAL